MILKNALLVFILCLGLTSLEAHPVDSKQTISQESHKKTNQHEMKGQKMHEPMHPLNQNPHAPATRKKISEKKAFGKDVQFPGANIVSDPESLAKVTHNMQVLAKGYDFLKAVEHDDKYGNRIPPNTSDFAPYFAVCIEECLVEQSTTCAEYYPDGDWAGKGMTVPVDRNELLQCFQKGVEVIAEGNNANVSSLAWMCNMMCVNSTGVTPCPDRATLNGCRALCCIPKYQNNLQSCFQNSTMGHPPANGLPPGTSPAQGCAEFINDFE